MSETEIHTMTLDGEEYLLKFDRRPHASRFLVQRGTVLVAQGLIDGASNPPLVIYDGERADRRITTQLQSRWTVMSAAFKRARI